MNTFNPSAVYDVAIVVASGARTGVAGGAGTGAAGVAGPSVAGGACSGVAYAARGVSGTLRSTSAVCGAGFVRGVGACPGEVSFEGVCNVSVAVRTSLAASSAYLVSAANVGASSGGVASSVFNGAVGGVAAYFGASSTTAVGAFLAAVRVSSGVDSKGSNCSVGNFAAVSGASSIVAASVFFTNVGVSSDTAVVGSVAAISGASLIAAAGVNFRGLACAVGGVAVVSGPLRQLLLVHFLEIVGFGGIADAGFGGSACAKLVVATYAFSYVAVGIFSGTAYGAVPSPSSLI
ncbi:hypothetical protein ACOSP7_012679 [Xanthoceras sorbifolium]